VKKTGAIVRAMIWLNKGQYLLFVNYKLQGDDIHEERSFAEENKVHVCSCPVAKYSRD
jgi:hypothetical protein